LLVCGSLLVSGDHGHALADPAKGAAVFALLPALLKEIENGLPSGSAVAGILVKDFYAGEERLAAHLTEAGFHRMEVDPNMIVAIDPEWSGFEDYLDALSAKYRLRANNAAKKLEGVVRREMEAAEIERRLGEIEALYLNVQQKAPVRIVRAGGRYFLAHKNALADRFFVRAFERDGRLIAFTSGFRHGTDLDAHFIGIDYAFNESHALYLNILYDFIAEAIRLRAKRLLYGRTALEIKSTVGAGPHRLTAWLKLNNRLLNRLITPFVPSEGHTAWVQRSPFREKDKAAR
jgi:hypothetical protein